MNKRTLKNLSISLSQTTEEIYKRKQKGKEKRNQHTLDQESDKENDQEKKESFFLFS